MDVSKSSSVIPAGLNIIHLDVKLIFTGPVSHRIITQRINAEKSIHK